MGWSELVYLVSAFVILSAVFGLIFYPLERLARKEVEETAEYPYSVSATEQLRRRGSF
jgi:hypothetical protein